MDVKEIQATFSKNLKYYLKIRNKTQLDLAKAIGVSNTTINNYVKGYNTPRMDKLDKICNYLRIERSDLLNTSTSEEKKTTSALKIPVLGNVAAGIPISAVEDILDYEEVPISWQNQGEFFALRIKGDSMQPRMENGDVVIVKQQSDANSGDTVIALVNGDDATCKRLEKTDNGIMLVSTNPKYPPMFFTKEDIVTKPVVILGKVVEFRGKF
ncbi:MAG: LexA family protein [Gemella haemolysans]|uniref:LexA family protein n=1 Tax=Gemella haemolysans TaxID=1379 RepID=UPI003F9FA4DD